MTAAPRSTTRRQVIRVACTDGTTEPVKAEVFGPLCVHDCVSDRRFVSVTHVKTGMAVRKKLYYPLARAAMLHWLELDWSGESKEALAAHGTEVERGLDIARGEFTFRDRAAGRPKV